MPRSLAVLLALMAWSPEARPSDPGPPPDLAARAWAITDAVLARHVDPPARQQMLLAGLKALHRAGESSPPPGLARRVSGVESPGDFAAILAESWPGSLVEKPGRTAEGVFLEGLLAAVPGGAELRSAEQLRVDEQVEGNTYVGIQVALGTGKPPTLAQVLPGGPAAKAGAKVDDAILAVDGVPTEGMSTEEMLARIRGEAGSGVLIRLRRADSGKAEDVPMTRDRLPRKTVEGYRPPTSEDRGVRLDPSSPVGYLKIKEVVGSTPRELREFAARLEQDGARALVLDLRELGHAGLHPTVLVADALLDGGAIGRVREGGEARTIRAEPDCLFREWPMVVLAEGTPSPEVAWLCAALQDNHRATVVGLRDAGPAVVRSAVALPGGWSVAMATGRLERADGRPLAVPDPRPNSGRARVDLAEEVSTPLDPYDAPATFRKATRRPTGPSTAAVAEARALLEAALKVNAP